jgi:hypothetical protein
MRSDPKRTAKRGKKESIFGQRQQCEKKVTGGAETPAPIPNIPRSQSSHQKAAIDSLPDFSADWQMPAETASTAEVEARFFYEFARESQTVLTLTESLRHFSASEILRASRSTLCYPGAALGDLHPYLLWRIALALMPRINLRDVSWNHLEPEQQESLIDAFSEPSAFREQHEWELANFIDERLNPRKPPVGTTQPDIYPQWLGSSLLYWSGVEYVAIVINWNQGPQAVKAAMQQWFQQHKRGLLRLKSGGKLPGYKHNSYMFRLPDLTGAKTPRRKYLTALRGLGAMRLLGSHTLAEAIEMTEGSLFARDMRSRSAWNVGVKGARQKFQELFYRQDEYSLRLRHHNGLPKIEEPISYQRFSSRRENKKSI